MWPYYAQCFFPVWPPAESIPCPELVFWIYYTEGLRCRPLELSVVDSPVYGTRGLYRRAHPGQLMVTRAKTKFTM